MNHHPTKPNEDLKVALRKFHRPPRIFDPLRIETHPRPRISMIKPKIRTVPIVEVQRSRKPHKEFKNMTNTPTGVPSVVNGSHTAEGRKFCRDEKQRMDEVFAHTERLIKEAADAKAKKAKPKSKPIPCNNKL